MTERLNEPPWGRCVQGVDAARWVGVACRRRLTGGHFGLIVLRHTASLFCHQRGSQSSYGALVRCIKSLASSTLRFSWSRGLNRSISVFFVFRKNDPFTILRHKKTQNKQVAALSGLQRVARPQATDCLLRERPQATDCLLRERPQADDVIIS